MMNLFYAYFSWCDLIRSRLFCISVCTIHWTFDCRSYIQPDKQSHFRYFPSLCFPCWILLLAHHIRLLYVRLIMVKLSKLYNDLNICLFLQRSVLYLQHKDEKQFSRLFLNTLEFLFFIKSNQMKTK